MRIENIIKDAFILPSSLLQMLGEHCCLPSTILGGGEKQFVKQAQSVPFWNIHPSVEGEGTGKYTMTSKTRRAGATSEIR